MTDNATTSAPVINLFDHLETLAVQHGASLTNTIQPLKAAIEALPESDEKTALLALEDAHHYALNKAGKAFADTFGIDFTKLTGGTEK